MKCLPYLICCLLMSSIPLIAQSNKVVVTKKESKRGDETNLVFSANNQSVAKQTIILDLNGGRYGRADSGLPLIKVLLPGSNRLLTLSDVKQGPGYGFTWVSGCIETKPKAVDYLLPVSPGKTTRIDTLFNIEETYLGKDKPKNWTAFTFSAQAGDTIFAARRGTIINIQEGKNISSGENISYAKARNFVVIEHEDCTRARYELFAKNGVFHDLGHKVEAGSPLGTIVDGSNYVNGSHLRFSVYYPELSRPLLKEMRKVSGVTYSNVFIVPSFYNIENLKVRESYQSEHPESVIFQEMTKREIKKWKKARGQ